MGKEFKGRFTIGDMENYGGQTAGSFFMLKDDKDTAQVRFMYNGIDDIVGWAVHQVDIAGKQRYVACIRHYKQPITDCPLCAEGYKIFAKFFLHLYDMETDEIKIWERGRMFESKISSLCTRYNPLVSTPVEIERNGKKGDINTTYEIYPMQTDEITLEDLPEKTELLGTLVLDKSFEEMEFYLDNGFFENEENDDGNDVTPPKLEEEPPTRRRTPPTTRRRTPERDKF